MSATATAVEATGTAKRRRDLNLYWWGHTTSAFGSVFSGVTIPLLAVVYLDASPVQLSMISAASILPMLLFGLPAGVFADRLARPRRTLMLLDTLSALTVGTVSLGVATKVASVGWLVALGVVQGCVSIVLEVVYFIHLRQLTDAGAIGRARARLQAGQYSAGIVGRLLAGPTVVVLGPAVALTIDATSYVLSALALLSMTPVAATLPKSSGEARTAAGGALRGAGAGLRFFVGDAFLRKLLVFLFVPGAAMAGVGPLTAPFLLRVLKVPTGAYGLLFIGSGLLGLAGSVVAGRLIRPGRDARLITMASFTSSLVLGFLLPLARGPLPVAALCAALGLSLPAFTGAISNVALGPVIVSGVAEEATGRVVAMLQVLGAASGLAGALAGGALGEWIGVRPAILVLDSAALLALLLTAGPALRAARQLR